MEERIINLKLEFNLKMQILLVLDIPLQGQDYMFTSVIEGLNYYNYKSNQPYFDSRYGSESLIPEKNVCKNEKELSELYERCDLIIFLSMFNFPSSTYDPPKTLNLNYLSKTVYIDATEKSFDFFPYHDNSLRNEPFVWEFMLQNCKNYFKRECYLEELKRSIIPFPYACISKNFSSCMFSSTKEKEFDVLCCFGQIDTGLRKESLQVCQRLKEEGFDIHILNNLPFNEYIETVGKARIVIDACGGGQINARFFEAIANKCLVFREKYTVIIPNDFDNSEIVEFTNKEELYNQLKYYLKNIDLVSVMANRSYEKAIKYHTPKARLEYLLKSI